MSVGYSIHFKSTRTFATFAGGLLAIIYGIWFGHLAGDACFDWTARRFAGWETPAQVAGFGATFLLVVLLGCALGCGLGWIGSLLGLATGFNAEQDRKRNQARGSKERARLRAADRKAAERRRIAKRRRAD
jgi:hypothetical protein